MDTPAHASRPSVWQDLRRNTRLFFEGALLSYIALFRWLRPMT